MVDGEFMGGTSRSRLSGASGHPKTLVSGSGRAAAGHRFDLVTSRFSHEPVLLEESRSLLQLTPGALVVDATLGGGGHAEALLDATAPDGVLLGLDRDDEALEAASLRLARFGSRARLVRARA